MLPPHETAESIAELGYVAFTTTRQAGSFGTGDDAPVREVLGRWSALRTGLGRDILRLATASQVHGAEVVTHGPGWTGWLRVDAADGHATAERGTALAVTIADCVPVFLAHAEGIFALLHAGWRGTAAGILAQGVRALAVLGVPAAELVVHFGPAICGRCYEVSPDVYQALTGHGVDEPTRVDLRQVLTRQAEELGLHRISSSEWCTRCGDGTGTDSEGTESEGTESDGTESEGTESEGTESEGTVSAARDQGSGTRRFFSHRAGDTGRQIAVIALR